MPKKRQLTKEERGIMQKSIARLKEEVEWQEYLVDSYVRDIDKGLFLKYKAAVREQKSNLRKLKAEAEASKENLKICENQLKFGVDIKEKKEDGK